MFHLCQRRFRFNQKLSKHDSRTWLSAVRPGLSNPVGSDSQHLSNCRLVGAFLRDREHAGRLPTTVPCQLLPKPKGNAAAMIQLVIGDSEGGFSLAPTEYGSVDGRSCRNGHFGHCGIVYRATLYVRCELRRWRTRMALG
jgi:hypothetical protein